MSKTIKSILEYVGEHAVQLNQLEEECDKLHVELAKVYSELNVTKQHTDRFNEIVSALKKLMVACEDKTREMTKDELVKHIGTIVIHSTPVEKKDDGTRYF